MNDPMAMLSLDFFRDVWNSQADGYSQWDNLSGDECVEFILSIVVDPLTGWPAAMREAKQSGINASWLIKIVDEVHHHLCPGQYGTWQDRAKQVAIKAQELSVHNAELTYAHS